MPTVSDLTERDLVARLQSHLPAQPEWAVVGIGDDGAVVEPERNRLEVLTVDAIVEGVHFDRRFTPPDAIGHRALAVNLSDLAAMGAEPRLALLSFALPQALGIDEYEAVVSGIAKLALQHKLHVIGGNMTKSPGPLMIDVTVMGTVKRRQVLTRAGAKPGDEVYVSGSIGSAAAGLAALRALASNDSFVSFVSFVFPPEAQALVGRYLYPEPRIRLGLALGRGRAATACMDLSDGLADAARQLAEASGVGMVIDAGALPIEPCARRDLSAAGADPVIAALTGGDDYELCFTASPRHRGRLRTALRHAGIAVTKIGVCTREKEVVLRRSDLSPARDEPMPPGYRHFG